MPGLLGEFSDGLQAASNAAASTVSGPVDLIAWLMRRAGAQVGDAPMGSSEWMERNGLTRPVKHGAAPASPAFAT